MRDYAVHYIDEDEIGEFEAEYVFPANSIEEARVMAEELFDPESIIDVEPFGLELFEEDEL